MTTLVWPSEAISKTVLDTLISPGGPFELQEDDVLGSRMLVFANRPRSIIQLLHSAAERMSYRCKYITAVDADKQLKDLMPPTPPGTPPMPGKKPVGDVKITVSDATQTLQPASELLRIPPHTRL